MNPTDEFTKAVESAHQRLATIISANQKALDENHLAYTTARLADDVAIAEALASIQASTAKLLEGLRVKLEDKHVAGELSFAGTVDEIDQLIKDLSNE